MLFYVTYLSSLSFSLNPLPKGLSVTYMALSCYKERVSLVCVIRWKIIVWKRFFPVHRHNVASGMCLAIRQKSFLLFPLIRYHCGSNPSLRAVWLADYYLSLFFLAWNVHPGGLWLASEDYKVTLCGWHKHWPAIWYANWNNCLCPFNRPWYAAHCFGLLGQNCKLTGHFTLLCTVSRPE